MPVVSRFYGIVIMMYFREHQPPHFHAKYEGQIGVFSIVDGHLIAGKFPPRATRLVKQWAKTRKPSLLDNWRTARDQGQLKHIEPLS